MQNFSCLSNPEELFKIREKSSFRHDLQGGVRCLDVLELVETSVGTSVELRIHISTWEHNVVLEMEIVFRVQFTLRDH